VHAAFTKVLPPILRYPSMTFVLDRIVYVEIPLLLLYLISAVVLMTRFIPCRRPKDVLLFSVNYPQ
jgi:hypothetical protein